MSCGCLFQVIVASDRQPSSRLFGFLICLEGRNLERSTECENGSSGPPPVVEVTGASLSCMGLELGRMDCGTTAAPPSALINTSVVVITGGVNIDMGDNEAFIQAYQERNGTNHIRAIFEISSWPSLPPPSVLQGPITLRFQPARQTQYHTLLWAGITIQSKEDAMH
eukprot:1157677-Amphidinium_carterae.2